MQILALFYDSHAVPECSGLSTLKDVTMSGSGDFTINGDLKSGTGFALRKSGSGDFKASKITATDISLSSSGAGYIDMNGAD